MSLVTQIVLGIYMLSLIILRPFEAKFDLFLEVLNLLIGIGSITLAEVAEHKLDKGEPPGIVLTVLYWVSTVLMVAFALQQFWPIAIFFSISRSMPTADTEDLCRSESV